MKNPRMKREIYYWIVVCAFNVMFAVLSLPRVLDGSINSVDGAWMFLFDNVRWLVCAFIVGFMFQVLFAKNLFAIAPQCFEKAGTK